MNATVVYNTSEGKPSLFSRARYMRNRGVLKMQAALRLSTWVRPGGKIEVADSQLPSGKAVDIIVLFPSEEPERRSIVDILAEAPGHLAFQTAEEVDAYVQGEPDAWER